MPKDDASFDKAPLKRGDACLYCRKRRIRCSATKPTCEHCHKLKRECVYDTGKPVSRVKQLEEKVAELEEMLVKGPKGRNGSSGSPDELHQPPPFPHQQSDDSTRTSFSASNGVDPNVFHQAESAQFDFSGFGGAFSTPFQFNNQPTSFFPQHNNQKPEETFDFSMLDPNFVNLVNTFQTSNAIDPFPMPQPFATQAEAQFPSPRTMDQLDTPSLFKLFTRDTPMNDGYFPSNGNQQTPFTQDPSGGTNQSPPFTFSSNGTQYANYQPFVSEVPEPQRTRTDDVNNGLARYTNPLSDEVTIGTDNAMGAINSFGKLPPDSSVPPTKKGFNLGVGLGDAEKRDDPSLEGLPLVGGWFDAADLPTVARDHLLDIFFSGMKVVGQEFHIPRFLSTLSLPPLKRPHPCLLYTMYLLASRASTHPPIRALESHFYSIALKQLEEAVAHADRLLDATRAATMLAVYKYGLAKYHEGYMMVGMAARLAMSSGLHVISSSVFKPSRYAFDRRADLGSLMRQRAYILGPPSDPIDLGERICAFWAVYTVDRCGSISAQWPPAIPDDIISTPYPRPLHEYELGLVSERDDMTISSVWSPAPFHTGDSSSAMILRLRSLCILERASKLMYLPPEPGWDANLPHRASHGSSPSSWSPNNGSNNIDDFLRFQNMFAGQAGQINGPESRGWTRCARIRTPRAYEQVREALLAIERDLPLERRTNWEVWDGIGSAWAFGQTPKKEPIMLHFVIGCSWMFLFDVFSFGSENTLSVNVARRLANTVRTLTADEGWGEMDVFMAMVWSYVIKILIREVKRLNANGDTMNSKPIESEIEIIVQALQRDGKRNNISSMQAMRADRFRRSTAQETEFLKGDDLEDEVPSAG